MAGLAHEEVFSSEGGSESGLGPEGDLKEGGASRKKQAAIVGFAPVVGAAGGLGTGIQGAATGLALAILVAMANRPPWRRAR